MNDSIGGVLMVMGALLTLLAGIGVLRFPDVYARMHAASKATTLGIVLIAGGAAVDLADAATAVELGFVVALQFLTLPIATHVVAAAIHSVQGRVSDIDELADDEALRAVFDDAHDVEDEPSA